MLTAAIEECGSLDAQLVAERLSKIRKRTVYGSTAFDSNRQNNLRFVMVHRPKTAHARARAHTSPDAHVHTRTHNTGAA